MSHRTNDPRCPECGEPIGQTATYCMHCSADLTDEQAAADADSDESWDRTEAASADASGGGATASGTDDTATGLGRIAAEAVSDGTKETNGDQLLAPDGLVDDTLTVAVGIAGGIVIGLVGTVVLGIVTESGWAVAFGMVAWLGATAYLVRRRTVQAAVAKSGYGIALVLLSVPVIAFSPLTSVDGGLGERGGLFVVLLVFVAVPAGVAAAVGWIASRFVPEGGSESDG